MYALREVAFHDAGRPVEAMEAETIPTQIDVATPKGNTSVGAAGAIYP